jgi:amino acid adenylation domain-containing protein
VLALAAGTMIGAGSIAFRSGRAALATLHPPRELVQGPPATGELARLQEVSFVTRDHLRIRGWYLPSHNRSAIILAHGHGTSRRQLLPEARILARHGYGVLLFDWRGHGESEGDRVTWGDLERLDLEAAVDFACARPDLDPRHIGALGFSMGGVVAAEVAAADRRLAAVVIEAAYPSLEEAVRWDFRRWGLLSELPAVWAVRRAGVRVDAVRPVDSLCWIHPRPVLVINGDRDSGTPQLMQDEMTRAACDPKEYWQVRGAAHGGYAQLVPREYERRLVEFFDRALRGHAVAASGLRVAAAWPAVRGTYTSRASWALRSGMERNDAHPAYPIHACVQTLFEAQAACTPHALAVRYRDTTLTYGQLNARANRVAHRLAGAGVGPDTLVAVCLERTPELIVAMLATLKAGGAYVPIDLAYPAERIAFMLADTAAPVLLTERGLAARLPAIAARVLYLDEAAWAAGELSTNRPPSTTAESLAYVMYTSGSTGTPKGVMIPHRGIVRLLFDSGYAQFSAAETFLQLAPVSFDASTLEIWGPLLHGGACVLFPEPVPTPRAIGGAIRQHGVTTMWLTASLFNTVIDEEPQALRGLRQLLIGGEALSVAHVRRALELLPETQIINGYGPTESTTFTCCYPIPRWLDAAAPSIPIGAPIAHTEVRILDEAMRLVPPGAPGELYVGGDGLARGYLNRPGLTAEKFVPDPFSSRPGARLYRTGDRVRALADGSLEFLGRFDEQVKLNGFRIEPGEIEAALRQHAGVRQAVVVVRERAPGAKQLVAYYTCPTGTEADPGALRHYLQDQLPAFMVPVSFVRLGALPLTANGKLDRAALPAPPALAPPRPPSPPQAPQSSVEHMVRAAWEEALGIAAPGRHDNFFDLGGQSLQLVRVHSRLRSALGRELPVTALFQFPTISSLVHYLEQECAQPAFGQLDERARRQREALALRRQLARGRC